MKATEVQLLKFLNGSKQFIIPIYQRSYNWTLKQCEKLWDDILSVATTEQRTSHFCGSVVYVERGLYQIAEVPQLLVIDGQQRLTTIALLLSALRNRLPDADGAEITARKITNLYLVNPEETGPKRHKLLLNRGDSETLTRLIDRGPEPEHASRRIAENYRFFEEKVRRAEVAADVIYSGIGKLMIVDIALDRQNDNPQLIFESLNSTGLLLSQADLIRNYVLMGLEPEVQKELYETYWFTMESRFVTADDSSPFDRFMRDFLTVKTGTIPNIRDVYEAFKIFAPSAAPADVRRTVAEIAAFAGYFARIALGAEPDTLLRQRFSDINGLKVDVSYPLLLELYHDYTTGALTRDDFARMLEFIESYVFRRAISGIPTNSLNKTFAEFTRDLNKSRYWESFQARLLLLDSYRRFPRAEEFIRDLQSRDVYNLTTRRHYLLRKIENFGRRELVQVDDYTIEHVLPQNTDLSDEWRAMLGPDWQRVQATYLHTLGNLTLTRYNSELSDRPFLDKREHQGGFRRSPLRLNEELGQLDHWNEQEIVARAHTLAELACRVWPEPALAEDVLAEFRPVRQAADNGTRRLEDHRFLVTGPMRELFELFRLRVETLGSDVSMHVLQLYIAFKARTNFVDVIPQSERLKLTINMAFADLEDPRGIAEDVTGMGRWGNGDIQVPLNSADEINYVMTLVEQSYALNRAATPATGARA